MRQPIARRLAVLVCSLLALACRDSLEPAEVAGVYALERIGSDALPAVMWETEHHTVWVTSGAIRLRADGTGLISSIEESLPRQAGNSAAGTIGWERPIRFRTAGVRIEIEIVCAANESCLPPPHLVGRPTAGGLRVSWYESTIPLHYARIADETE